MGLAIAHLAHYKLGRHVWLSYKPVAMGGRVWENPPPALSEPLQSRAQGERPPQERVLHLLHRSRIAAPALDVENVKQGGLLG